MANIVTPKGRAVYVQLTTARKSALNPNAEAKYTLKMAFPPESDFSLLKKEVDAAVQGRWGGNPPKNLRKPFRKNSELDKPVEGIPEDWIIVTFSCNESSGRPGVVDANARPVMNSNDLYAGMWCLVQANAYTYPKEGTVNCGVAFGLQNVQKVGDDEPIRGARQKAESVFKPVGGEGAAAAAPSSIFD